MAPFECVVDRARRAFNGAARFHGVADLRAEPRRVQQRLDRLAEELVIRAAGDDTDASNRGEAAAHLRRIENRGGGGGPIPETAPSSKNGGARGLVGGGGDEGGDGGGGGGKG